jgi:hypothetical protein
MPPPRLRTTYEPDEPGFFQKLADVAATPQRAAIGFFEGLASGDISSSVEYALASRRGFSDILREQGAEPAVAGIVGFGLDVLADPLNLLPVAASIRLMGKGAVEAGVLARRAILPPTALPRTVKQMMDEVPRLSTSAVDEPARRRGRAASEAFRKLVPEGKTREDVGDIVWTRALADAKRDALTAGGRGPIALDDPILQGEFARGLFKRAVNTPQIARFKRLIGDAGEARRMFVTNLGDALKKDPAFGSQGSSVSDALTYSEDLGDAMAGEWTSFYKTRIRPLLKTEAERVNFTEIADGSAIKALTPNVEQAVSLFRNFDNEIVFKSARSVGLRELVPKSHSLGQEELFPDMAKLAAAKTLGQSEEWVPVPIQYRQNHVPHYYKPEAIRELRREGGELREQALKKLIDTGQAENKPQAGEILNGMLRADDGFFVKKEFRGGPLQFARELLLDIAWEKDPDKWFQRYSYTASRRLSQAAVFGPQDEMLEGWLKTISDEGGDLKRATDIRNLIIGRPSREQYRFHGLASGIGAAQNIIGLGPKTALLQFMQLANSVGAFGVGNTIRALGATIRDPDMLKLAREAGALLPSEHMAWEGDIGTSWSNWWVHNITRMPQMDRVVRVVSGIAGMLAAKRWAEGLQMGGKIADDGVRQLRRLGIDARVVMQQEGELSAAQLKTAVLEGSKYTQFASHLSDMPETWRSPLGRFLFKFRSFSKQQSHFVGTLVDEAVHHKNPKPLMRYLAAYPAIYTAARPALDFLAGRPKKEDEEAVMDYLKGLLFTGALGAVGDFFTSTTASDPMRAVGMITGPALAQGAQALHDIGQATFGEQPDPLLRSIRRTAMTPVLRPLELLQP